MRIDGQMFAVQRAGVFDEVSGHPVVFIRPGHVLDELAPVAPVQLDASFP